MSSVSYHFFLAAGLLLFILLLPASSQLSETLLSSSEGMLVEDKARLGSAPPNCHNRCNGCTPCTAVQDPTAPAGSDQIDVARPLVDSCSSKDKCSDYKPLGWKCRCGDRLYNP